MKMLVELRYAVLTSVAGLLWLFVEFELGFQDKYIAIYPLVTLCSLVVPVLCFRQAFREKSDIAGSRFTTGRAVLSGFLLSVFTSILSIPIQIFFLQLINPDFMADMIQYGATKSGLPQEAVAVYINLQSLVAENAIFTFVTSLMIGLILALRYRAD